MAVLVTAMAAAVPESISNPSALFSFIFPSDFPFSAFLSHFLAISFLFSCCFAPPSLFSFLDGSLWLKGAWGEVLGLGSPLSPAPILVFLPPADIGVPCLLFFPQHSGSHAQMLWSRNDN